MTYRRGRYSGYIRPALLIIDLLSINAIGYFLLFEQHLSVYFHLYITVSWIFLSLRTGFYKVYRNTKIVGLTNILLYQALVFTLITYAFFGIFQQHQFPWRKILMYVSLSILAISTVKYFTFFFLKKYRKWLGGNLRQVVIIGKGKKAAQLKSFFQGSIETGYNHLRSFDPRTLENNGEEFYDFVNDNNVDEIYCSLAHLNNKQINELIDFADNNLRVLKFIPDNKDIYLRKLKYEYYGMLPIISLRDIPLDDSINRILKRLFDVAFSLSVIIFILSWLTPRVAILIKIESRGPVFFKQLRSGINNDDFWCYKFRSMTMNKDADKKQTIKNDLRITKIGKFIRKTSIDELPQFFNVLLGDMSVVGPRPHMVSHTRIYAKSVDKYMVRHFIKPGITGLAQVRGYRGEILEDKDIINRVKYDIFYIENWSLILDVKIIVQTTLNAVKGDEKAY